MKAIFNENEHLVIMPETVAEDMALKLFCSRKLEPMIMSLEHDKDDGEK